MRTVMNCPCSRWVPGRGWVGNRDCFLGCNGSGVLTVTDEHDRCTCPMGIRETKQHSRACPEFKDPALPPAPVEGPAAA